MRTCVNQGLFCVWNMTVKAACSCKNKDEKPGVMFAAAAGSDLKPVQFAATEDHACSFARGDWQVLRER